MTDDSLIREPDEIRQDCVRKMSAVQISDHFQAILGCLLGQDWTTPRLAEMVITPDGHLIGRCDGGSSFKAFLEHQPTCSRTFMESLPLQDSTATKWDICWGRWQRSRG